MISERQLFLHHVAQTSPSPMLLEIAKADGVTLIDVNGKKYIDLISGISVSNIGHRHPAVVKAIKEQVDQYMHVMVYGEYVQSPQVKLAALLSSLTPGIDSFYFVNSGSEAIEGCIKLAKRFTGRKKIIAFKNAYHGSTTGALSLMYSNNLTAPFEPLLPGIEFLNYNNIDELEKIDSDTAAVFLEIIQGEAGAIPGDSEFIKLVGKICRLKGALVIVDEIQTGYGRTGSLFSFMKHSLQPDIIAIAKGMGGGMPLGAFGASQKIMQTLSHDPALGHITTFGGNAVCCAAGLATLKTLNESGLINTVASKELLVRKQLNHPLIKNITGFGLLLGVQFPSAELNQRIISRCIENGVITDWFLFAPDKMRIAPPLIITEEELTIACDTILKSIDEAVN